MATTNISTEIVSITGVSAHAASDEFIVSAQKFIASSVPKDLLWFAVAQSSAIQNSSGSYTTVGNILRIANIELPFTGEVRYSTPSVLGGSSIQCFFRFEINQKGKWEIRVSN